MRPARRDARAGEHLVDPRKHVVSITSTTLESDLTEPSVFVHDRGAARPLREFEREQRMLDAGSIWTGVVHGADPTAESGRTENMADSTVGGGPSRSIGSTAPRS